MIHSTYRYNEFIVIRAKQHDSSAVQTLKIFRTFFEFKLIGYKGNKHKQACEAIAKKK